MFRVYYILKVQYIYIGLNVIGILFNKWKVDFVTPICIGPLSGHRVHIFQHTMLYHKGFVFPTIYTHISVLIINIMLQPPIHPRDFPVNRLQRISLIPYAGQ